ncbi:hypothetical protein N5T63_10900 [Aliarcobacter cryaerophilus]|uniref:hypothetical protein n=1 Tax=Aliarcobacter cryaerophilus TaxID=28198 RepID=UPI0021B583AF|nr:hypothetical protein [Aliarcobacter cryaerophilus]MCT7489409.1 hypothetical protein [Aliarcobacter cryaerophilus]
MQLPTIPTDNLYKFMSISGLLVMLFFFLTLTYSIYQLEINIMEEQKNTNIVKSKVEVLDKLRENYKSYIKVLEELLKEKEITKKEFYEIKYKELSKYTDYLNNVLLDISIGEGNIKKLENTLNSILIIGIISFLGILIGFFLARRGFKLWYEKLQVYQDRNIKDLNSNRIIYKKRT